MAFLIVQRINIWRDKPSWDSLFHHFPLITLLCSSEVCMLPPPFHSTPDTDVAGDPSHGKSHCMPTGTVFKPDSSFFHAVHFPKSD